MMIDPNKWKDVRSVEHECGGEDAYGWRIQFSGRPEISEWEKDALYKAGDILDDAMLKARTDADPKTHERARTERDALIACFGGRTVFVEEIPNGYCNRGCCAFFPWLVVTTSIGRIKIGWRKRVIELDWTWSVVKQRADELFAKEDGTTRFNCMIHCYGYEKAAEYINRLFQVAENQG